MYLFLPLYPTHWRKIQSLGLVDLYINNELYSVLLRSFTALAFVPTELVTEYFKYLSDSFPQEAPITVHDFVHYLADTYVCHEIYKTGENEGDSIVLRIRITLRWRNQCFLQNCGQSMIKYSMMNLELPICLKVGAEDFELMWLSITQAFIILLDV